MANNRFLAMPQKRLASAKDYGRLGLLERLGNAKIMKGSLGKVSYSVTCKCPYCSGLLSLTQHPYTDEDTEMGPAEDLLGLEVFGTPSQIATWENLKIQYKCNFCKEEFQLTGLEID